MADENNNDASTTPDPAPQEVVPAEFKPTPSDLGDAGKKALSEERAARKAAEKEREALSARLKEFEDRDKSEAEKLAERAAAAEAERDALKADAIRARVALTKGIPADLMDRLRGSSEEEVAADADRLMAVIASSTKPLPRGAVDQGERDKGGVSQLGRDDLSRMSPAEIEAARKAGRFDRLMAGK